MAKVAEAANLIVKLPAVPARVYSNVFYVSTKVSEKQQLLHGMKLVTIPCDESQGSKMSASCLEGPTKHLALDFRKHIKKKHG